MFLLKFYLFKRKNSSGVRLDVSEDSGLREMGRDLNLEFQYWSLMWLPSWLRDKPSLPSPHFMLVWAQPKCSWHGHWHSMGPTANSIAAPANFQSSIKHVFIQHSFAAKKGKQTWPGYPNVVQCSPHNSELFLKPLSFLLGFSIVQSFSLHCWDGKWFWSGCHYGGFEIGRHDCRYIYILRFRTRSSR